MLMDRLMKHNKEYVTSAMAPCQIEEARGNPLKYPFEWERFLEPQLQEGALVKYVFY